MSKPSAPHPLSLFTRFLSLFKGTSIRDQTAHKETVASEGTRITESPSLAEIKATRDAEPKPTFQGLANLRVLLVEDIDSNRARVREMLDALDHHVIEATDGSEAIALAETERPDVILMDISLPTLDGWKATKFLREHHDAELASLPIIAMTNQLPFMTSGSEDQTGMSGYLCKPFDQDMLVEQLHSATASNAFEASILPEDHGQKDAPLLDPSSLSQDLEERGLDATIELIDSFELQAPELVRRIHEAPTAASVVLEAESLKKMAGNIGLMRLEQKARAIEHGEPLQGLDRIMKESQRSLSSFKSQLPTA